MLGGEVSRFTRKFKKYITFKKYKSNTRKMLKMEKSNGKTKWKGQKER